jgi:hypothetical protein
MDLFNDYFLKDFRRDCFRGHLDRLVNPRFRHRLNHHPDHRPEIERVICVKFNYLFLFIILYIHQQYFESLSELDYYYYFNYEFVTIQYSNSPLQQFKYFFNALNRPYFDLPPVILVHHLFEGFNR